MAHFFVNKSLDHLKVWFPRFYFHFPFVDSNSDFLLDAQQLKGGKGGSEMEVSFSWLQFTSLSHKHLSFFECRLLNLVTGQISYSHLRPALFFIVYRRYWCGKQRASLNVSHSSRKKAKKMRVNQQKPTVTYELSSTVFYKKKRGNMLTFKTVYDKLVNFLIKEER
jgi:hypothetical protein